VAVEADDDADEDEDADDDRDAPCETGAEDDVVCAVHVLTRARGGDDDDDDGNDE
jgi:hypothetical protein